MRFLTRRISALALLVVLAAAVTALPSAGPSPARAASAPATCPLTSPERVSSLAVGATRRLVPVTPTGALVCRYGSGFAQPQSGHVGQSFRTALRLDGSAHLSAAQARQLAAQYDRIRDSAGVQVCPDDVAATAVTYFSDAKSGTETVMSTLTGCASSTNGHLQRRGFPAELIALTTPHVRPVTS